MVELVKNILGVDVGERRIGLAVADSDVRISSPLPFLANDDKVFNNFRAIISDRRINVVVFGLPRNSVGEETKQSAFSRNFASNLRNELGKKFRDVEFAFQDESLTSVKAESELRARKGFREEMLRDGTLDSEAATIILTDFLEANYGK